MAAFTLFTIGENAIPLQMRMQNQTEGAYEKPFRNYNSNKTLDNFPKIQYMLSNEQKAEEHDIPPHQCTRSKSRTQTEAFVTRAPLHELETNKYGNNVDNPLRHNDKHHSKYVRSNVAMTLWTMDELKTYLYRNDFTFDSNKDRPYYYRLAAIHRKFQETIQQKDILKQKVMSLSQSIRAKDVVLNDKIREMNTITSEKQLTTKQYQCVRQQTEQRDSNYNMNENQFRKLTELQHIIQSLKQENESLRTENTSYSNRNDKQNYQMQQIQIKNDAMNKQNQIFQNDIEQRSQAILKLKEQCHWYQQKSRKDEDIRKKLHNKIQKLKGNIRVFCRVRPLFEKQDAIFEIQDDIETQSITLLTPCTTNTYNNFRKSSKDTRYCFSFDRVFTPSANQDVVFNEISELVQSALDGYKVCIFAYGQTGSGKTFTMNGASLNQGDESRGMIPRSIEQIFEHKETLKQKGWDYKCCVSYLEIYNEKIIDLLVENKNKNKNYKHHSYDHQYRMKNGNETQYLEIHQRKTRNGSNEVYVDGLKEIEVLSSYDVYSLLTLASKNRSFARTDCNERSSRSHTVFQLFLNGYNNTNGQKTRGVLNLIDLAGSERLKKSNATGIQLKETQNINKSLSSLGDVIAALSSKKHRSHTHIPYRNSKLTYLLMNYFGGEAKTLMFVNLCPEKDKTHESLCSLRFAAKVNDCQIGIAKRTIYK